MILESKLVRILLIVVIFITVIKQIFLTQTIYALSSGALSNGTLPTNILPSDKDEIRPYKWKNESVTLSKYVETNGKQILEMEKEITDSSLTADQKKRLEILGKLPHPCCNAPIDTKDCLHAQAAMGLAKYLITLGYDDQKIKKELFLWYRFWWPKHYAIVSAYLQSKGVDPKSVSVDDWMSNKLSIVSVEQSMMNELGGEK